MIVLELLHLKMEVSVSEPCDVIRVTRHTHTAIIVAPDGIVEYAGRNINGLGQIIVFRN